jgi:hypothetical protein
MECGNFKIVGRTKGQRDTSQLIGILKRSRGVTFFAEKDAYSSRGRDELLTAVALKPEDIPSFQ